MGFHARMCLLRVRKINTKHLFIPQKVTFAKKVHFSKGEARHFNLLLRLPIKIPKLHKLCKYLIKMRPLWYLRRLAPSLVWGKIWGHFVTHLNEKPSKLHNRGGPLVCILEIAPATKQDWAEKSLRPSARLLGVRCCATARKAVPATAAAAGPAS